MTPGSPKPQVDTSRPHPARVYDYFLGGKDNYPVDRALGERLGEPAKLAARHNRALMRRVVAWLAGQGIDQFLDIGTGIPTEPNLHQVVQRINPAARIVYTDNDPIVLRHAEALLVSTPEGVTDYIEADIHDPERILEHARKVLDFNRPVALSLVALLHFLVDDVSPYEITRTLVDALPSGSYLFVSHATLDNHPQLAHLAARYNQEISYRPRTKAEVERFFAGTRLVEPGVVPAPLWTRDLPADPEVSGIYGGVGRVL